MTLLSSLCTFALALGPIQETEPADPPELFRVPPVRLEGDLEVSELHTIHYTVHGRRHTTPVILLHGGPGYGAYPRLLQYFDPKKFRLIVHDQRGCGRSRPLGELRENTTQELVADIERLREHLSIDEPALVFGGSWGSTLALAYAEAHPEHVAGLILRGVFTGTRPELENGYAGAAPRLFFPDAVARLEAAMPEGAGPISPETFQAIFESDDRALALRVASAWASYSFSLVRLETPPEQREADFGEWDPLPACRVDVHYGANLFFLEEDQLLRDAPRLREIPTVIINGRYDILCPPAAAWRLHELLPNSELVIVESAGHSETEPGIERALLEAAKRFE